MKAYELQAFEKQYRLVFSERPSKPLKEDEIRVRVKACSLNYRDLVNQKNLAGRKVDGRIPLSDGAGEVVEIGATVTRFKLGERVAGCFFPKWIDGPFLMSNHQNDLGGTIDGMLAEEVIGSEQGFVSIPKNLTYEEAACLPCAGLTAWYALTARGNYQSGQSILVLGTGGVSIFGLQFGVALGAKVLVTSSSDAKLERTRTMGASATVNYKLTPAWEKEIFQLTEKRGVDHILEVGGPGTLEKSIACLAANGTIALIGVLTGFGSPNTSLFPLVAKNARLNGIYVGSRVEFEKMNAFIEARNIHPIIDKVFAFSQAEEAYRYLESASHFGKVVIKMD
ncbi:NAD(P)-dependent alcohol dehydrogenase [Telmatocola sphagniphila]|uniref:NAD(P)-dependent alcohol dehydrogenase n=1 Tax=Telmatocola sphagniphila TaxID=1123043 RepID=A0A8E6B8D5_9BACT|nr:NAD(P)-dependent alcohol dehydrogenase [Telmatocola sphagniphila]QVL33242.1 NAD(P)-dependent alcohol dehydrogenase [Telmatocola sphagniphila]